MQIKGDVKGGVFSAHRLQKNLVNKAITATETLTARSAQQQRLSAAATQDVILPDATTLLNGAEFTVISSGAANLVVKDSTPVTVKTVASSEAFTFILMDNATAAGVWRFVKLAQGDAQAAARFVQTFDATTSWGTASGGFFQMTITEATHGMGVSPNIRLEQTSGADFIEVFAHEVKTLANGDLVVTVPENPECRFQGRAVIS